MKRKTPFLIISLIVFSSLFWFSVNSIAATRLNKTGDDLNTLRDNLASTLKNKNEITPEDFKNTCGIVKQKIMSLKEEDITVKQISHKNRNEQNAVPSELKTTYEEFLTIPKMDSKQIIYQGKTVLLKRITVTASCLKCHGVAADRPAFIKEKYKNDKAFDFKEGDLRGLYIISENNNSEKSN